MTQKDDHSADRNTTGTVAVGGTATGQIETVGDRDWFAVTLKAQRWYRIDVEGHDAGNGALQKQATVMVHSPNGRRTNLTEIQPGQCFSPDSDVTYWVEVGGSKGDTGGYRLSIAEVPDDYAAGTDTKGAISVGGEATGELEHGRDSDWFAVTLEAGKTYRIDAKGRETGDGTLADPGLGGVFDAAGRRVAEGDDDGSGGKNSRVLFTAERDGTYYVEADAGTDWSAPDRSPWIGTYTLSVVEVAPDLVADASTTGTVAVGAATTGEIERYGDRDWFAVTLEAGKTYVVDLKGKDTGDGTLADPYLDGIRDAAGNRVGTTWDYDSGEGRNSQVTFTVETSGTYYVAAGASGRETGTYTLAVAEAPPAPTPVVSAPQVRDPDDFAADAGTTGTVSVGGEATGEIERSGDRDWFAVTLEAGKTYTVDLKGRPTGDGTLKDPYLDEIRDARGNAIAGTYDNNGGTGRNSQLEFSAETSGVHYLAAGATGSKTGTYTLAVAEVQDDYAAGTDTTGAIAVGGTAAGEIERPGDRDWFAVTLEAGKTYVVDLKGRPTRDGTLKDPSLDGIYDARGNAIAGTYDDNGGTGRNSRLEFTAETSGVHYLAAGATGSKTGTYTLAVAEVQDDYAAGTDTTGAIAVGGTATGEIEQSGDRDWFAVTFEAGKTYVVDLKGRPTRDGTLKDPSLDGIYDARGNAIAGAYDDNGGAGRNSRLEFTAVTSGVHYVAAGDAGSKAGTYTLAVTEDPDLAATASTTGRVAVGSTAAGEIERSGDRDWFAVTLEAGKTYVVDLKGRSTRDGTLKDPYLDGIYDAAGNRVDATWDNDSGEGRNSQVTFGEVVPVLAAQARPHRRSGQGPARRLRRDRDGGRTGLGR